MSLCISFCELITFLPDVSFKKPVSDLVNLVLLLAFYRLKELLLRWLARSDCTVMLIRSIRSFILNVSVLPSLISPSLFISLNHFGNIGVSVLILHIVFLSWYLLARDVLENWDKQIQSLCFQVNGIIDKIAVAAPDWFSKVSEEEAMT